jgi:hypothetical protein
MKASYWQIEIIQFKDLNWNLEEFPSSAASTLKVHLCQRLGR